MARRSGGSSARMSPRQAPVRNPPQSGIVDIFTNPYQIDQVKINTMIITSRAARAPPPAPNQSSGGSFLGGIGSTIAQGMAFGTGSSIAHRAVDSVMGPRTVEVVASEAPAGAPMTNATGSDACSTHSKAFQDCINNFGSEISKCQFYLDMLNECRRGSGSLLGA